jgi:CSLREA domain-containing protein
MAALPATASAATITPDTLVDDNAGNGNCTLREAVIAANTDAPVDGCAPGSGADEIRLAAGTYELSVPGNNEDLSATGDLDITDVDGLKITGAQEGSTVDANEIDRVFHVDDGAVADFDPLTITGGRVVVTDPDGGGVLVDNAARATFTAVTVRGNFAQEAGGGIDVDADAIVAVTRSTLSGNRTDEDDGGGIQVDSDDAVATIDSTTVNGNVSGQQGGGVEVEDGADATIVNSTISGNTAESDPESFGGGIRTVGSGGDPTEVTISNSTIANNAATVAGGGAYVQADSTITLKGTILATNTAPVAPDCGGPSPITSQGHNLVQNLADCTFNQQGTDLLGADPLLAPLADNGGPTQTQALRSGSPAIDAGPPDAPPVDQRGAPRSAPDVGAYELVVCQGVAVNRIGSDADDTLTGTDEADAFLMQAGNDTATGGAGNDVFCGGAGNDSASGDAGNDSAEGDAGNDTFSGGEGDDADAGGEGDDTTNGDAGNDSATGDAGNDIMTGGDGKDVYKGLDGNDTLKGLNGKDRLKGGNGKDKLKGGKSKDRLNGGKGKDRLNGGKGKDVCKGAGGKDKGKGCEKEKQIP